MTVLIALLPILLVMFLMLVLRWNSTLAGFAGWCLGLLVALLSFGLTWDVFWVSQVKGVLLTINVMFMLWPSIFLYNYIDQIGGIRSIALSLEGMVKDKGWLLILKAWMLSATIESLAGFGLPIAMIAPLLITLGVPPVVAVAAPAVGHTWASSTGGMALSLRLLSDITRYSPETLFPASALLLGISIILSGLAVAYLLGQKNQWWRILITGTVTAGVHYFLGFSGLIPVSALVSSVVGFIVGSWLNHQPSKKLDQRVGDPPLLAGLIAYGILVVIMLSVSLIKPLSNTLSRFTWTLQFPAVSTSSGFMTPAEGGYIFHIFTHPGTLIILSILITLIIFRISKKIPKADLKKTLRISFRSGLPVCMGSLFMIGLSTTMEHTGMTLSLANTLSIAVNGAYPLFAPIIGVLGSFTTGSNVNSNVLFGVLQKQIAILVGANPIILLAAQTTGGSLGSSIAPAKLALGTSTSSAKGHEGEVLRKTLPICLIIAVIIGIVTLIMG